MQALIKTDLWIDIHVFFDLTVSELINNIVRFLTSAQGVDINHTLVEGALIVTNRNTILLEPRKGLGSKEGRKIFIRTSAGKIRVPCWCILKGFSAVVKSLKQ